MKKPKQTLWLFICVLLAWSSAIQADDLYATEVRVIDESPQERSKGLGAALAIVIKKISDNPKVLEQAKIAEALPNASALVQQFRYRVGLDDAQAASANTVATRYLWAKFDKAAVDKLLQQANINVRAQNRPKILLWLAAEQQGQRRLLDVNELPESYAALMDTAKSRAIPLQLPLLDLQDQAKLQAADLWADDESSIRLAAQRYPHDAILVGRLRELDDRLWSASWSLFGQSDKQYFTVDNVTLAQALSQGLDDAQDRLVAKYAPRVAPALNPAADSGGVLLVRFSGIDTLRAYSRLLSIIKRLGGANRFQLRQVEADTVLYEVIATGGSASLARSLEATGQFIAIQAAPTPEQPVDLTYQMLR